eukprot:2261187-Alexandrium_andersonii.AAC.1
MEGAAQPAPAPPPQPPVVETLLLPQMGTPAEPTPVAPPPTPMEMQGPAVSGAEGSLEGQR